MNSPSIFLRLPPQILARVDAEANENDEVRPQTIRRILERHFGLPPIPMQIGGWPKGVPRNGVKKKKRH